MLDKFDNTFLEFCMSDSILLAIWVDDLLVMKVSALFMYFGIYEAQWYYTSQEEAAPIFLQGQVQSSLSEEEQIRMAQRLGLISHLPTGVFDGTKKKRECVICMIELEIGDPIRFLPCMHIYHKDCIDDWLLRSFTCPSCMEPVDAALLSTFYSTD